MKKRENSASNEDNAKDNDKFRRWAAHTRHLKVHTNTAREEGEYLAW